jgi:hypothetical protein
LRDPTIIGALTSYYADATAAGWRDDPVGAFVRRDQQSERNGEMIEVDARTRSASWGIVVIILGAGWVANGLLGGGNTVFMTEKGFRPQQAAGL